MLNLLFAAIANAFTNQCQYNISFLNFDGWITITTLVVLVTLMISAIVYAFSGLLPGNTRERLRGVVKYEYVQGLFSVFLIISLFGLSLASCNIVGILTQGATTTYTDPFQFANTYVGNLLFTKGLTLITSLISAGVDLTIVAFAVNSALDFTGAFITYFSFGKYGNITPYIANSDQPLTVIYDYGSILDALLAPIIVVTFGLLFVVFLMLPAIEALALTLIIPVAMIMRSLAFTGPRLREASNVLIAISVAFYFVFPMTLAMNFYVVNWTYCINGGLCNPYASYLGNYQINTLPISKLFNGPEVQNISGVSLGGQPLSLPYNFYGDIISSNGGLAATAKLVASGLTNVPNLINGYVQETAQYLFQAIFLMALDVGITIGFALGLNKGLDTLGQMLGVGPFWGA
jgi:hypothetical protein